LTRRQIPPEHQPDPESELFGDKVEKRRERQIERRQAKRALSRIAGTSITRSGGAVALTDPDTRRMSTALKIYETPFGPRLDEAEVQAFGDALEVQP
jgi:hypothetical protein